MPITYRLNNTIESDDKSVSISITREKLEILGFIYGTDFISSFPDGFVFYSKNKLRAAQDSFEKSLTLIGGNKSRPGVWFAGTMDEGIVAKAETMRDLLNKLRKNSAQYVSKGLYEVRERNSERSWSIWIMHGEEALQAHGFNPTSEHNTWSYEKEA